MVNKALFNTVLGKLPPATAINEAGAPAYALSAREALAQYAVTGTFHDTFYAEGTAQLEAVAKLALEVDPSYLAKVAIYAAETGYMKDMPVTLLAILSGLDSVAFSRAFPRVVRSGKMLRGFVQVMRSGAFGRRSLGTRPKRMVQSWFEQAGTATFLNAMIGNEPSLPDVIRMVHPKPRDATRRALYAWAIGKPYDIDALPAEVVAFEAFKRDRSLPVPAVPFQMLTSPPLAREQWGEIALRGSWQMVRQNLNTFARNGVFEINGMVEAIASRLADPDQIRKAKVFPYQLMMTWQMVRHSVPPLIADALQEAVEVAIANVPVVAGRVVVCPDVSGSMRSPATGYRPGATSAVRCIDVAALVAAGFLRQNRLARMLPFEQSVVEVDLNGRDSVVTNAAKLAAIGGGGTNCSAPLRRLAEERAKVDLVVFISDNQSWMDPSNDRSTETLRQWASVKRRNPTARLVCLDIQPAGHTQAVGDDVLNIGGFSDAVYDVIASFASGSHGSAEWIRRIEAIEL